MSCAEQSLADGDAAEARGGLEKLLAVLIHLAILAVCFSALYIQPQDGEIVVPPMPVRTRAMLVVLALGLIIPVVATSGRLAASQAGRGALALGFGVVVALRYAPLVFDNALPDSLTGYSHTLADLMVPLLALLALAWSFTQREAPHQEARMPILASAIGLAALALLSYIALGERYGLDFFYSGLVLQRAVSYGLIFLVAIRLAGSRGFGSALHWYAGLTLLLVVGRSFVFASGS